MDLFKNDTPAIEEILPDVWLLKSNALANEAEIVQDLERLILQAPLRHMMTPMGFAMSAAMTNCGPLGWVSDRKGYRYDAIDPISGKPWPQCQNHFWHWQHTRQLRQDLTVLCQMPA